MKTKITVNIPECVLESVEKDLRRKGESIGYEIISECGTLRAAGSLKFVLGHAKEALPKGFTVTLRMFSNTMAGFMGMSCWYEKRIAEQDEAFSAKNQIIIGQEYQIKILNEKLRKSRSAICLLNSMVKCGENHSEQSRNIVQEALAEP